MLSGVFFFFVRLKNNLVKGFGNASANGIVGEWGFVVGGLGFIQQQVRDRAGKDVLGVK